MANASSYLVHSGGILETECVLHLVYRNVTPMVTQIVVSEKISSTFLFYRFWGVEQYWCIKKDPDVFIVYYCCYVVSEK